MGVIEDVGSIAELIKKIGDIELYRQIVTLETKVRELSRDKMRSDDRVVELETMLKFKEELTFKDGLYWLKGDETPFCPACWDAKKLAIRIKRLILPSHGYRLQCPNCQTFYHQKPVGV
jgi:hypothetical protein